MPRSGEPRAGAPVRVSARSLENAAARYVERHGGTTVRLRTVLRRRMALDPEADPALREVIESIIGRYVASGQIDDAAFAAARAIRLVRRGVAPAAIRGRLTGEGLDAVAAMAAVEGDPTLSACVNYVRRRRLGALRAERDDAADLARLGRAGFPYAVAKRVLAMDLDTLYAVGRE